MSQSAFINAMEEQILVLDGGFGSMLQRYKLDEAAFRGNAFKNFPIAQKGNYDLLNLTQPAIVQGIHEEYFAAGARIVTTNTLGANPVSLSEYGMAEQTAAINTAAVRLARAAARRYETPRAPLFVAASVGPTSKSLSISPDVSRPEYRAATFEEMKDSYRRQMDACAIAGADLLLLETMFDTLNVKAALIAAMESRQNTGIILPIVLSAVIADSSGRMLAGQTLDAFVISVSNAPLAAIGLNCALGAAQLKPHVQALSAIAPCCISAHPNAGLPNQEGGYDQTPAEFASIVEDYMRNGWVNIVGGCCGTTPEHIALLAQAAPRYKPRKLHVSNDKVKPLFLSGLEALTVP